MLKSILAFTIFTLSIQASFASHEARDLSPESEHAQTELDLSIDGYEVQEEDEYTRPADIPEGSYVPVDLAYGNQFRERYFQTSQNGGVMAVPVMNRDGDIRIQFRRYKVPAKTSSCRQAADPIKACLEEAFNK